MCEYPGRSCRRINPRAAQRLLESTQRYLEGKLKLRMNVEKSKVVSVYSIRNFKFLGFALGKGKNGVYIRAHDKSKKKAKARLKELTSRRQGRNVRKVMENVKVYIRGWLGYFGIASMKTTMRRWDEWLRRRIRIRLLIKGYLPCVIHWARAFSQIQHSRKRTGNIIFC